MVQEERLELRNTILADRYHVHACIGVGGTGVVFSATRRDDNMPVVVKTLRPMFVDNADLVRRLRREGEVTRRVAHPGIVPVYDDGMLRDGSPFMVMRRMYGESLARILQRVGTLGVSEAAVIAMRVASILHSVHQKGYVHRDIKPEHILLDRTARGNIHVSLLDFGVCASESASKDEKDREKGRVFGTPSYVSPEQAAGNPHVTPAADLFGIGVTLFEALTGSVPFQADNITALLRRIIREKAPRVRTLAPHADGPIDNLVACLLERRPERRLPSARALTRALAPLVVDRVAAERRLAAMLVLDRVHESERPTANGVVAA